MKLKQGLLSGVDSFTKRKPLLRVVSMADRGVTPLSLICKSAIVGTLGQTIF